MQATLDAEARGKADFVKTKKKLEQDINELEIALDAANRGRAEAEKNVKKMQQQILEIHQVNAMCSCCKYMNSRSEITTSFDSFKRLLDSSRTWHL